jgi:hypothetical protein
MVRICKAIVATGLILGGAGMWMSAAVSSAASIEGAQMNVIFGAVLAMAGLALGASALLHPPEPNRG